MDIKELRNTQEYIDAYAEYIKGNDKKVRMLITENAGESVEGNRIAVPTYVEDGSLAMGNLMNAAYAAGLGSCWINRAREMFDSEEGKKLLSDWDIPETFRGIGFCILGYAEGELPMASPRRSDQIKIIR